MKEPIKTKFEWDDLEDPNLVWPCEYCEATDLWPTCDDGATSSACNHCAFAIMNYACTHNMD